MEKFKRHFKIAFSSLLVIAAALLALFYPVFSYGQIPVYSGAKIDNLKSPQYDNSKKTVFIVADGKMTEMFDMLAPFYTFNATQELNVFIVAKDQTPIPLKRDLFVLPQMTFQQVDAQHLKADVIVIPAMFARDNNQDPAIINFIKNQYGISTKVISICDGATTAAQTGLYDGKLITAHATDLECVKKYWDKPIWTQNVTVTKTDRVYSTAGVANAVDGSLLVIEDLLGKDARLKAAKAVNYPHAEIQIKHNSQPLSFGNKLSVLRKMLFNKKRMGLLLHDGFNELKFASIVDTYSRTYPKEFKTFTLQDSVLKSKHGLTFIHTGGNIINPDMDEVHVIMPEALTKNDQEYFKGIELVKQNDIDYPMDQCISHIEKQFGEHYAAVVKLTLDYN
jgi:putative intracellular protease/amidase